jgi:dienelactone hydrolase
VLKILRAADRKRSFAMRGLKKIASIALMGTGFLTGTFLSGCGGGTNTPPPVISIGFTGGTSRTIAQGQSTTITVNVSNDQSGKGVTWKLTGPGSLSKQTSLSVEYDAPASVAGNVTAMITATSLADTSKSAPFTMTITPPPQISVSVAPSPVAVPSNTSQVFTATVQNDSSNKGVTWTISPASGAGTLSNATSTSVTYTAPATLPTGSLSVTITATSVIDTSKSGSASVTVPVIAVSVDPPEVTGVEAGTKVPLTATVSNDPANKGVLWTISPASGAGTLSNMTGSSVTYNAPASPPASDLAVTITATSVADPSKSGSASVTLAAITVSLEIPYGVITVPAGTTQSFTATVNFDPSNSGVSWALSPATGVGTLSNATNTSVIYHAPADAPVSNLTVTITATSLADSSKTGSATITIPVISVSVSPGSVLMPINATQQFTGTVNFDPTSKGTSWAPFQGGASCGPACGTFAPTSTASGATTTYTAPVAVPANPAVAITATSVTDTTKSGAAAITLTNGTVKLVPAVLAFGHVKHSRASSLTVSLTNTGNTALSIGSMTTTTHFKQTNDCGVSVGPGTSCTITVTFSPGATGSFSGTLTISDSSLDSPQLVHLSGTGTALIAASMSPALATEMTANVPKPTGPTDVGTRVADLVDSTRDDFFLADGTKRELLVRFWYPASLKQDCKPAEYTSPAVWSYFSQLVGVPLPGVRTNSCQDADIANGTHPVVIFTPGYTGTFTDYTFLFEDLASRGYVVASVNHTGEATVVEFPDGRIVKSLFGSHLGSTMRTDEDAYTTAVIGRLSDLKFVMKELDRLNAAKGPFAGKLDMSRVALAGHSLGGLTALLGVEQEPRFRAGIVLDGVAPDRAVNATETPLFVLITGRQLWSVDECRLWSNLRGPRLGVKLPGAEHLAPSDSVWLAKGMVKTGGLSPDKTIAVLRNYIAAFLDANLRGQPMNTLLTGQSPDFPDVVVTTQAQLACGEK